MNYGKHHREARETEFRGVRSQTEFGNERNERKYAVGGRLTAE
jgi:hypothetical protein